MHRAGDAQRRLLPLIGRADVRLPMEIGASRRVHSCCGMDSLNEGSESHRGTV